MNNYIIALFNEDLIWYMEWCPITDAPVTFGMYLDVFKAYIRDKYGWEGARQLNSALPRLLTCGVSTTFYDSADDIISYNRAGRNGTRLTKDQILDCYCWNPSLTPIEGTKVEYEDC